MANLDSAFGFRPVRMLNGGKIPMHKYANKGATTAIFQGDRVALQGADGRLLRIATTTPNVDCIGVAANYIASGTAGQDVWVYDDPNTVFEVQSDGTTDTDHNDYIGSVAACIAGTGNTTSGLGADEIDASSITSSGTATNNVVKIIGVSAKANNDSSLSHCVMEVLLMNHMFGGRILTASV